MVEAEKMVLAPPAIEQHTPLNLIPVGLKEAALDSPTFRATALHFADNIDAVERWLDGYIRAAGRLVAEVSSLESAVNSMLALSTPPAQISEAVLDHDYTLLAMRRYGEGAREFWANTLRGIKRYDNAVVDPIKGWLSSDLRSFKDARRAMESAQKNFDSVLNRYSSQSKAKESSSLREDAFQLHEARKLYLKSSMDFCVQAPQLRASLDKLIVRIFSEQWKEMRQARESGTSTFAKWSSEMERVRGWSREMENSERAFKRELATARKQIEERAEQMTRPSRELEDYAASTVPYLGSAPTVNKSSQDRAEKQGWLFLRTITGKPARTVWSRRWFFVKSGIFGWLVQGTRSGGVEESERTGVLLCSVRPAFQEERRFCFEVKTKDQSITLQAETQQELTEWIAAFEIAKRKALEDPASTESSPSAPGTDPAFAISPPAAPEFAAKMGDGHVSQTSEDAGLGVPGRENTAMGLENRASFDTNAARRVMSLERDADASHREGTRDRLISKLDLHKRTTTPQLSQGLASGGIASLISASHNILPVGPGTPQPPAADLPRRNFTMPTSTLAPSTLANPPAATNLSHTAVVVSGERGIGLGHADGSGMPSGILANLWGSSNWGHVNRIGEDATIRKTQSQPSSPRMGAASISQDDSIIMDGMSEQEKQPLQALAEGGSPGHRKTLSIGAELNTKTKDDTFIPATVEDYPNYYPLPLKAQHAQFRMLFPTVPKSEKVVLVFRATWNPNEQQEFPGRVYVTAREIYFFSNHLGLVLVTGVNLTSLSEVTAAPGRDCDFVYLHLKEANRQDDARRITIKTFLEPLKLLQRRINFLVQNADADEPAGLEDIIKRLIRMETEEPRRSSSVESWEDVAYDGEDASIGEQRRRDRNIKASLRIDGNLYGEAPKTGREIQKFKLPAQAVSYSPAGLQASITRDFNVSAKALFHVMFGDKSAVFQLLYSTRWAETICQTPWTKSNAGHWHRKFTSPSNATPLADLQVIDIFNDHLCYVVTNDRYPWHLPYASYFTLTTKFVITHTAKSRSKLAVFHKLIWLKSPPTQYLRRLIERQAYNILETDALDLANVAMDQVAKLGNHSKTNKAVEIFGSVGQQTQRAQIDSSQGPSGSLPSITQGQGKRVTVLQLVSNDVLARSLSAMSIVLDLAIAIGKGAISLCTGHTLLVLILLISGIYNGWHGWRDGLVWYHDRSAANFMSRLGVVPDLTMGRAVYLNDIEELVTPKAWNDSLAALTVSKDESRRSCRTTFSEQLQVPTILESTDQAGSRLRRSRDFLARHRHDLLVALRVVNRVEKDMILAAWEEWVRSEEKKCQRVEDMLRRASGNKLDQRHTGTTSEGESSLILELGEDFAEYCMSCSDEVSGLVNGSSLI